LPFVERGKREEREKKRTVPSTLVEPEEMEAASSGSLHYAFRQLYLKYEDTVIVELRQEWPPLGSSRASIPRGESESSAMATATAAAVEDDSPSLSPLQPQTSPTSSPPPPSSSPSPSLPPSFGAFQLDGSLHYSLFGVFDGHCGGDLARHCTKHAAAAVRAALAACGGGEGRGCGPPPRGALDGCDACGQRSNAGSGGSGSGRSLSSRRRTTKTIGTPSSSIDENGALASATTENNDIGSNSADGDPSSCRSCAGASACDAWRSQLQRALVAAIVSLQASWAPRGSLGGSTATLVLVAGRLVTCANVGDSAAFADDGSSASSLASSSSSSSGKALVALTGDHRVASNPSEASRVSRCTGALVANLDVTGRGPATNGRSGFGPLRVWGNVKATESSSLTNLADSEGIASVANARALGDVAIPGLLPLPLVVQCRLPAGGGRVLLGSDGVWDCVDAPRATRAARGKAAPEAADAVLAAALRACPGGVPRDDTTVVVVDVLPRGVPSFPEALGKKLKRSASRADALHAAGLSSSSGGGGEGGGGNGIGNGNGNVFGTPSPGSSLRGGGGGTALSSLLAASSTSSASSSPRPASGDLAEERGGGTGGLDSLRGGFGTLSIGGGVGGFSAFGATTTTAAAVAATATVTAASALDESDNGEGRRAMSRGVSSSGSSGNLLAAAVAASDAAAAAAAAVAAASASASLPPPAPTPFAVAAVRAVPPPPPASEPSLAAAAAASVSPPPPHPSPPAQAKKGAFEFLLTKKAREKREAKAAAAAAEAAAAAAVAAAVAAAAATSAFPLTPTPPASPTPRTAAALASDPFSQPPHPQQQQQQQQKRQIPRSPSNIIPVGAANHSLGASSSSSRPSLRSSFREINNNNNNNNSAAFSGSSGGGGPLASSLSRHGSSGLSDLGGESLRGGTGFFASLAESVRGGTAFFDGGRGGGRGGDPSSGERGGGLFRGGGGGGGGDWYGGAEKSVRRGVAFHSSGGGGGGRAGGGAERGIAVLSRVDTAEVATDDVGVENGTENGDGDLDLDEEPRAPASWLARDLDLRFRLRACVEGAAEAYAAAAAARARGEQPSLATASGSSGASATTTPAVVAAALLFAA